MHMKIQVKRQLKRHCRCACCGEPQYVKHLMDVFDFASLCLSLGILLVQNKINVKLLVISKA
jgi:hypothetical protein